jgi:hypothetical protein
MITLRSTLVLGVAVLAATAGLSGSHPASHTAVHPRPASLTVVDGDAADGAAFTSGGCYAPLDLVRPTGAAAVPATPATPATGGGTSVSLTVLPAPPAATTSDPLTVLDCALAELVTPVSLG